MTFNKYGVSDKSRRTVDGIVFASLKEMRRYCELKTLLKAGQITDLEYQVPFILQEGFVFEGKKIRPIKYVADFVYQESGKLVVEDTKGVQTPIFKLKRKMFIKRYGYDLKLS